MESAWAPEYSADRDPENNRSVGWGALLGTGAAAGSILEAAGQLGTAQAGQSFCRWQSRRTDADTALSDRAGEGPDKRSLVHSSKIPARRLVKEFSQLPKWSGAQDRNLISKRRRKRRSEVRVITVV